MLLVGHDDGLSVLNMYPKEWTDGGLIQRGPNDAEAHHILTGEGLVVCCPICGYDDSCYFPDSIK